MHSPFPWITHPQAPTNVYDADGMKAAIAVGPNAEDNAALIAAIPAMIQALQFYRDGFLYSPNRSRTGVDLSTWEPKSKLLDDCGETARAVLASIGKTP